MKPVQSVLTISFALIALGLTVWFGRYGGQISVAKTQSTAKRDTTELAIPTAGPFGKAVPDSTTFDFGTLEKGDKGSHTFVIKNDGPGPLRIKGGKTSCSQCTISKVSREDDIPPGESVEVLINYEIKIENAKFRHTAEIFTTDPENPKFEFAIQGLVDKPLHLAPEGTWAVGDLSETEPTTVEGVLYSTLLDQIEIDRCECANPLVKITWEPAPANVITEKNAKSALNVKAVVAGGTAVGPFREKVTLHTTVRGGRDVEFYLSGRRPGPIEVKGAGWNAENNLVVLGTFPAAEGKKARLSLYVRNFDGELQVQQQESENGRVRVRVTDEGKAFGKSKVYNLEVEVLPGATLIRRFKEAEQVLLKLNHPSVTEFKMFVDYYAK